MARNRSIFITEIAVNEYRNVSDPSFFPMNCNIQLGYPEISFARTAIKRGVKIAPLKRSMADWIRTAKLGIFSFRTRDFQIVVTAMLLRITVEIENKLRNTSAITWKIKLFIVGNLIITSTSSLEMKQVLMNMLLFVVKFISA